MLITPPNVFKGKRNIERNYFYQDRTFQAEKFDTILTKIDQQIKKLLEFKYLKKKKKKKNVMEAAIFRLCDATQL